MTRYVLSKLCWLVRFTSIVLVCVLEVCVSLGFPMSPVLVDWIQRRVSLCTSSEKGCILTALYAETVNSYKKWDS